VSRPPPTSAAARTASLLNSKQTFEQRLEEIDRAIAAEQRRLLSTASLSLQQVRALKDAARKTPDCRARNGTSLKPNNGGGRR
jgi:hypothetical protein